MHWRKSQRLANYDYSRPGFYFVTITPDSKEHTFGDIVGGVMRLNKIGKIVEKYWYEIPNHFNNCKLDAFILMPNHVHGIIKICENNAIVGNRHACSVRRRQYQTLSIIIGGFKSASSKLIHQLGYHDFKWHKSFNDRIIRRDELNCKRNYIKNNPKNRDKKLDAWNN